MDERITTYNKKEFLLPGSIRSAAIYHAKVMDTGEYMFRIHDCNTGVRLRGFVTNPEEVTEAVQKLRCLAGAALEFADFIENNYTTNV